jgi:hypothetical protein
MPGGFEKHMYVFFCNALYIHSSGPFQNGAIASRPRACREPLGRELGAERPPGRTTRGRKARPSRRVLSFRNLSVGEIPPEAGRGAKPPRR